MYLQPKIYVAGPMYKMFLPKFPNINMCNLRLSNCGNMDIQHIPHYTLNI